MKIKVFTVRLSENELEIDQNSLNDFLETVTFKKSSSQFVESENDSKRTSYFSKFKKMASRKSLRTWIQKFYDMS